MRVGWTIKSSRLSRCLGQYVANLTSESRASNRTSARSRGRICRRLRSEGEKLNLNLLYRLVSLITATKQREYRTETLLEMFN